MKGIAGFVCKTTVEEFETAAEISAAHPVWVKGQKNYADPFVIAHAKADNRSHRYALLRQPGGLGLLLIAEPRSQPRYLSPL